MKNKIADELLKIAKELTAKEKYLSPDEFTIDDYGIDFPDYFTGVSSMGWDGAVTGVGEDFSSSLDDALDQLAQEDLQIKDEDINKALHTSNWKNMKSDTVEEFIEDAAKEQGIDLEEYQETLDMYPQYYTSIKFKDKK